MASSSSLQDQSDEMIVSSQFCPKARKTYTIKKQREKWTEQEHDKFVEALKLHGRAWRHIEEHIGTKTAVQIRSHAQKFFSKVVRDSIDATSSAVTIEIPPPRPKRKPAHPYPRKTTIPTLIRTGRKTVIILDPKRSPSVSEQEHQSPTSVLSGLENSSSPSPFSSHDTNLSVFESDLSVSPKPNVSQTRSLKLFGTTVLVETSSTSTDPPLTEKEEVFTSNPNDQVYYILIPNEDSNQIEPLYPLFPIHRPVASRKSPTCLTSTTSSSCSGSVGDINGENDLMSKEVESESSGGNGMMLKKKIRSSFSSEKRRRNCCKLEEKGFVPYKKCLISSSVRDEQSSDSVEGRIRLCL